MNDGGDEYDEEDLADSRTVKIASERVASQIQEAERNSRCEQEEYDDCTESKVHRAVFKSTSACPALRKRIFFSQYFYDNRTLPEPEEFKQLFCGLGVLEDFSGVFSDWSVHRSEIVTV